MIKELISIVVLAFAFPVGIILAGLTKEELKPGKKYFSSIVVLSFIAAVFSFFTEKNLRMPLLLTMIFIVIVTLISIKSK